MARCLESTRPSKASFYSEEFRTGVRDRSLDHAPPFWCWLGARTARIGHRAPAYFARGDPKVVGSNPTGPAPLPRVPISVEPTTFGSAPPIAAYLWELQKRGYKPQTIQSHGQILRLLSKQCKL